MHNDNRRKFLKSSATLAAGVSLFGMPGIVRAGANDRIRVAVVGREDADRTTFRRSTNWQRTNVDLAALCDCDEANLNQSERPTRSFPADGPLVPATCTSCSTIGPSTP